MKLLMATFLLLATVQAHALSDREVSKLYSAGKLIEKNFSEIKIPESKKNMLLKKINDVAMSLANVWPDTVLEGPYQQLSSPTLDLESITPLYAGKELVGFFAIVSSEAAFSDNCSFNDEVSEEEAEEEYTICLQDYRGLIVERFIVNVDGNHIEEYADPADFQD